jgi:hypothetical protein
LALPEHLGIPVTLLEEHNGFARDFRVDKAVYKQLHFLTQQNISAIIRPFAASPARHHFLQGAKIYGK